MPKSFLGKPVPERSSPVPKRRVKPMWFGLLVLPALAAGGLLSLQRGELSSDTGPRTTGGALARSIAANERRLAAVTPSPTASTSTAPPAAGGGASTVPDPCPPAVVSREFKTIRNASHVAGEVRNDVILFPIVPDGINGYDRDGKKSDTACSPPFWNRAVVFWFVYKALAFLNWLAMALAILLSLYGGILYITGFANEGNVKKAKGIIIGAYTGLIIVFLAKILVFGAINLISDEDPRNVESPVELGA